MKILLVRPKPKNIFARLQTVCFEPLELEYLAAVVNELNHRYEIYDGLIVKKPFLDYLQNYQPDVVAITGYTIHVNLVKEYAGIVKEFNSQVKVLVGGIHAELNWQDFYEKNIDIVIHSNPLNTFREIIKTLEKGENFTNTKNICFQLNGKWSKTEAEALDVHSLPFPDRTHLRLHKDKFRYFGREQCALVKTAWGCCYKCNFCYCACLNGGKYSSRNMEKVVQEIREIEQKKIFIIDDDFLVNRERILQFCSLIKKYNLQKDFSIYGRADLICMNEDILPSLKIAGISEIIVGLEACDDQILKNYNKLTNNHHNFQAVQLLRKNKIASCGLFIVDQHYGIEDFRKLSRVVKKMELDLCMFSIFTPLKGVPGYEKYKDKLLVPEDGYEYTDFLHLIIRPTKVSIPRFYFEFYKLYFHAYTDRKRFKANFKPLVKSLVNLVLTFSRRN